MPGDENLTSASAYLDANLRLLRSIIDTVVPADDWPSAGSAGGVDFLRAILEERPEWVERVAAVSTAVADVAPEFAGLDDRGRLDVLETMTESDDYQWFARLVNDGYYADPGNGGNTSASSWSMVGFRSDPVRGWSGIEELRPANDVTVRPDAVRDRYDAIVVGTGAGGGVAACSLAEAGLNVLVIESGGWPSTATLARDHLRNPRSSSGLAPLSGPVALGSPRVVGERERNTIIGPADPRWNNNAMTVGGGTRVYGAQAWRFGPIDFAMASTYGVPDGSALSDWPIGYDDLEPYYERAEWEIGVSGDSTDGSHSGARRRPYPMRPLPGGLDRDVLAAGAAALGISTLAVPLLINSRPYLGRSGCVQCAMCVGFACPVDAKNGSQNTMLDRAFATGRASIALETSATRVLVDAAGRVCGVAIAGASDGRIWRKEIAADRIVVAAGAIESARLLLNSANAREPRGIGNNLDQVGRYLQGHLYGGSLGIFDEPISEQVGPGPSIATGDFRHGSSGIVGGGILANEFVPTPSSVYHYLTSADLIPLHGPAAKQGMRDLSRRMVRVMGPIQEVTTAESRVRVDPAVRDRFGVPAARLSGTAHPEDVAARDFISDRTRDWLQASGARTVVQTKRTRPIGPSGGQHQAGTLRMGTDPSRSATDPAGRVWGHDNLFVTDGSVHVTNGGANPVLTIFANAMRVMDSMLGRNDSASAQLSRVTSTRTNNADANGVA